MIRKLRQVELARFYHIFIIRDKREGIPFSIRASGFWHGCRVKVEEIQPLLMVAAQPCPQNRVSTLQAAALAQLFPRPQSAAVTDNVHDFAEGSQSTEEEWQQR